MPTRLNIEIARNLAIKKEGVCLSTIYTNTQTPMIWKCKLGHIWESKLANIISGTWCPKCNSSPKHTIEECVAFAKTKNGKCLSDEYKNSAAHMLWECDKGHQWRARFAAVKHKTWCPVCCGSFKKSIEDCVLLAETRNGRCISKEYKNNKQKLIWQCEFGHQWNASVHDIQGGCWCPTCNRPQRISLDICQQLASEKGGYCLSTEYINSQSKMLWKCNCGHEWWARTDDIKNSKSWCPQCVNLISQNKLANIIKDIFLNKTLEFNYTGFKWLKTNCSKRCMEIDIWLPDLKLAIEYDGRQHFEPVCFGGISFEEAKNNLISCQERDAIKNKLITEHQNEIKYFVRFNYLEPILKEYVIDKLKAAGVIL